MGNCLLKSEKSLTGVTASEARLEAEVRLLLSSRLTSSKPPSSQASCLYTGREFGMVGRPFVVDIFD